MREANKDEADNCLQIAEAALAAGDLGKAERFVAKAQRLFPTDAVREAIKLMRHWEGLTLSLPRSADGLPQRRGPQVFPLPCLNAAADARSRGSRPWPPGSLAAHAAAAAAASLPSLPAGARAAGAHQVQGRRRRCGQQWQRAAEWQRPFGHGQRAQPAAAPRTRGGGHQQQAARAGSGRRPQGRRLLCLRWCQCSPLILALALQACTCVFCKLMGCPPNMLTAAAAAVAAARPSFICRPRLSNGSWLHASAPPRATTRYWGWPRVPAKTT